MLELRRQLDLTAEPVAIDPGREVRREHLDDDRAAERAILRHEDATHATAQKLALELVAGAQRLLKVCGEVCHGSFGDRTRCRKASGTAVLFLMIRRTPR